MTPRHVLVFDRIDSLWPLTGRPTFWLAIGAVIFCALAFLYAGVTA